MRDRRVFGPRLKLFLLALALAFALAGFGRSSDWRAAVRTGAAENTLRRGRPADTDPAPAAPGAAVAGPLSAPDAPGARATAAQSGPDYDVVFPDHKINQIKLIVAPEDWQAMHDDMTDLYGEPGRGPSLPDRRPRSLLWVPATVEFEGRQWHKVGLRFKGHSSLWGPWQLDSLKLPFKLDFDQFEDEYPETHNQRFFGFKQLTLANHYQDHAMMRDWAAYDVLSEAGLVAAAAAHYEVLVDHGAGPVSMGLYTMIEVIEDTVVPRFFGDDRGNIYEAVGPAGSLALGALDQLEAGFEKQNNKAEGDWSDLRALYLLLHSEERTSDPQAWQKKLESIFEVDVFLRWLALSAVIQHWDTYGFVQHNYYLYNNPATGRLTWISRDHDYAMSGDLPGRHFLDKSAVGEEWPLIRYLLDVPAYHDRYVRYLEETVQGPFNPQRMAEKYRTRARLIAAYGHRELGPDLFNAAVEWLVQHAFARAAAVEAFVRAHRWL